MSGLNVLLCVWLFGTLVIAVYTDVSRGKVYDWCTYPAILVGIMGGAWIGGWKGGGMALLGGSIGALLFLIPMLFGMVGGGDVKLMGAVGALAVLLRGFSFIFLAAFLASLVGAVMALGILVWHGKFKEGLKSVGRMMVRPRAFGGSSSVVDARVPYAVAIAAGTMWAWWYAEGLLG